MSSYQTINIFDMIDAIGEDNVKEILSDFSCPKNREIENFVRNNAIEFAKRKMSVTHLVVNENGDVPAIFTLTHKAIEISNEGLSSASKKKISRYAHLDEMSNSYILSAFLIAQFGKNFELSPQEVPDGDQLMENAWKILVKVQHDVGGGIVYLECENSPKLLSFYQNEHNRFRVFNERYSETDQTKYIQLFRFL